jgi:hypothetical protein
MGYKMHTNKTNNHKQNIEFMEKNDYETLEILIINIASNTHLNNNKTLAMTWIYLLESIPKKMKSKPPPLFPNFYGHRTGNSRDLHCTLSKEEEVVACPATYIEAQ